MLIFYHRHFQLSSLCNWPSSGACPLYNILSLGVKGTSSVLWSSANFCSISQNMHYKAPVASQQWNTNQVVWTWKDDWPPWRTSTYETPFTREGNYLVSIVKAHISRSGGRSTPQYRHPVSIFKAHIGRSCGRSTPQICQFIWMVISHFYS